MSLLLEANTILKMKSAGDLFNKEDVKAHYKSLVKKWHPDHNSNSLESHEVMKKINELYKQAVQMKSTGLWESSTYKELDLAGFKTLKINYIKSVDFELGVYYHCPSSLIYVINESYHSLVENFVKNIKFSYPDSKMKDEVSRYLPKVDKVLKTYDNKSVLIVNKESDFFVLRDILNFYEGKVPLHHVAWIMNSMYSLACFLDYFSMVTNGFSLDTYFISPKLHYGSLLGGWWYSGTSGSKMIGVSKEVYNILPNRIKNKKENSLVSDIVSIRAIGKKLLGIKSLSDLNSIEIPKSIMNFFLSESDDSAILEIEQWEKALQKHFGKRKFVTMDIKSEDIYNLK